MALSEVQLKKKKRLFSFKNPRDFIFHCILTPTQKPSEVSWPTLPSSFALHLPTVTILLSSSLQPSADPPGCWAGGPQRQSYHSLRWAKTTGRIPKPVRPLAPPSFRQWRSCRSRSVQTARALRLFSPPRTPASQRTSADGEGRSAPSSRWEPPGPTGQWPSRPLVWNEATSLPLWKEKIQLRNIFHWGRIFKKVNPNPPVSCEATLSVNMHALEKVWQTNYLRHRQVCIPAVALKTFIANNPV